MKLGDLVYLDLGESDSIAVLMSNPEDSDHLIVFDLINNSTVFTQKNYCFHCGELIPISEMGMFKDLTGDIELISAYLKILTTYLIEFKDTYIRTKERWEGYELTFDLSNLRL